MVLSFKQWLSESKGIRVTDEIEQQIDALYPKITQAAVQSKQTGEDVDVGSIQYADQYFKGRSRTVDISVINDPNQNFDGDFNPVMGVRINVAHVKPEEINPRWIRRLLVHEVGIHSQDPKISDFNTFSKMGAKHYDNKGGIDYYTNPLEFDAYTGQIVDSIIKLAKISKNPTETSKMLDDTLAFIKNPEAGKANQTYGIIGDPDYWKSFHIYYMHGSPDQKRRMYQRIYKAVVDAKGILAMTLNK